MQARLVPSHADRPLSLAQLELVRRAAKNLFDDNTQKHLENGDTFTYAVPSHEKYHFQWGWDSCFHAIVLSHFDLKRAQSEIQALLSAQRADGFVPHVIYWDHRKLNLLPWSNHWSETRGRLSFLPSAKKPRHSELIQPPLVAQAVERIYLADDSPDFCAHILPSLNRYYEWLRDVRDPDRDHLISIVSPYESGVDASPAYDEVIGYRPMGPYALPLTRFKILFLNALLFDYDQRALVQKGPFHVEDVLVNSIYALNLQSLARLNQIANHPAQAEKWSREAALVRDALIEKCWDEQRGAFFNINGRAESKSSVLTIQSLMPIILPDLPSAIVDRVVNQHLLNPHEFWTAWPVPSVSASEPSFSPDSRVAGEFYPQLWRGSSWVNTNWYLTQALHQHGFVDSAAQLAEKTVKMVFGSGLYEYFNCLTGAGLGARQFGWSTLAVDLMRFISI